MTEAQLQAAIVETARLLGWLVYHTFDSRRSAAGFPDLVMVRGARLIFAELKSAPGTVRVEQETWLRALRLCAPEVYLWKPSRWTDGTIERVLR